MRAWRLIGSAAFVLGAGCGEAEDGIPRFAVHGEVTLDGRPLERGEITFAPSTDEESPFAVAAIEAGAYRLEPTNGPAPGSKIVRIRSSQPTGKKLESDVEPGTFVEVTREAVPVRYNDLSELHAEVKAAAENRFDFELTTQKSTARRPPTGSTRSSAAN